MDYIISQILGGIVFVFVFASMQTKSMTRVLLCQIGCNGLGMLSYVLIGGFSACGIYILATLQAILFFWIRKKNMQEPRWLKLLFMIAYLGCSAFSFESWVDLFPMLAGVLCACGIGQKNATNYRIIMLLNGAVWTVYDLFLGAYAMLATHIFVVVSALIGIIRLDILKKSEDAVS